MDNSEKLLYIIAGANGSGKSTLANVLLKEKKLQQATLQIKKKYGKNAILKGMNLKEGATTIERNKTIGGHKA